MPNLRLLRYFVAAAEDGSVTRAARKLGVSQPSLSQAIAQLESQLGVKLFARHSRGITLTSAGAMLFVRARAALEATDDADLTARSLSRAAKGALVWGFIGTPPMLEAPELFAAFLASHPDVELSFRELPYPRVSTAAWLEDVDVALCYSPTPHPDVQITSLHSTPRAAVMPETHPLADRRELAVADLLDEMFCGNDPSLEPVRAGFWRLDDHRGGPGHTTADRILTPQEALAVIVSGRAIMTAPLSGLTRVLAAVPGVVAIPVRDAHPATLTLAWLTDRANPLIDSLASTAESVAHLAGDGPVGED